jgi:hypothetical protein
MRKLEIVDRLPASLTPRKNNPRTHTPKHIRQIANAIEQFGWTNPILIDEADGVVAGHGRLEAAKLLGLEAVPTVRLSGMSPEQIRAYVIADNKLAELAGWDRAILASEFTELAALDLDFDLGITGFETAEVDLLINPDVESDPLDALPEAAVGPAVSQVGDLWDIGVHAIACGSALDATCYAALMGQEKAQMVCIDGPYNCPIAGHVSGLGKHQHREFPMGVGEMSKAEFVSFYQTAFGHLVAYSIDGSIHFAFMDWRNLAGLIAAGESVYTELKNVCVWDKGSGAMGSLYRSQHEFCVVFKNGKASHINNVELGKYGRTRTNVWSYPGANSFGRGRDEALAMHPTVKPVAMIADVIKDCSKRKGLILDCFAGSGTTLVAAHKTGRRGRGIELDPLYVDLIVRRLQTLTGAVAILAATGETFAEVAARRTGEAASAAAPTAATPAETTASPAAALVTAKNEVRIAPSVRRRTAASRTSAT